MHSIPEAILSPFLMACQSDIPPATRLMLAISGGADSVALLYCFLLSREKTGIDDLMLAHVNHGLRGSESDAEEYFVKELARTFDLPLFVHHLTGKKSCDPGVEAWARTHRYAFFALVAEQHRCALTATAHTASDQVETVLMNIRRGAGLRGLCGMPRKRPDAVVRPLLEVSGTALRAWLAASGIAFRVDASNSDTRLLRNAVRHVLLPQLRARNPDIDNELLRVSRAACSALVAFEPLLVLWKQRWVHYHDGQVSIDKSGLQDPVCASEGLMRIMREKGIETSAYHIGEILSHSATARTGARFALPGGWWYRVDRKSVQIHCTMERVVTEPLGLYPNQQTRLDARWAITMTILKTEQLPHISLLRQHRCEAFISLQSDCIALFARRAKTTDTFTPYGRNRPVLLMHWLKKQGISHHERIELFVVISRDDRILWVPGIAIAAEAAVAPDAREFIRLQYEPNTEQRAEDIFS